MKFKWQQAPVKTQWGDEMVVASVAIDNDHTVCLYCEHDQTAKVEAMFTQRTWVGLTDEDFQPMVQKAMAYYGYKPEHSTLTSGAGFYALVRNIEAKLKEKNT